MISGRSAVVLVVGGTLAAAGQLYSAMGRPFCRVEATAGAQKAPPASERERVFGRRWWSALLGARCALAGDKRQRLILINRHAATAAAFGLAGRPKWAC